MIFITFKNVIQLPPFINAYLLNAANERASLTKGNYVIRVV